MPTCVVYVDEVFVENLVMDFLLLYTAARLCKIAARPYRLGFAAALGALYALCLFFPVARPLVGAGGKLLMSLLMVVAAYAPLSVRRLGLSLAAFYMAAVGCVGGALVLAYLLAPATAGNGLWDVDVVLAGRLAPAMAAVAPVLWFFAGVARRRKDQYASSGRLRLVIHLDGQTVGVDALVDTGNSLADPVTGHPVVVVESESLRPLLPESLTRALFAPGELDFSGLTDLSGEKMACRLRLIPFQSLGRSGLLLGFRPDRLEVFSSLRNNSVNEVVVAITRDRFDPGLNYHALVHPSLMGEYPA